MTLGRYILTRELAKPGVKGVDLARRCGMSPPALSQLANGRRLDPTRRHALALWRSAGIPLDAWDDVGDTDDPRFVARANPESLTTLIEGENAMTTKQLTGREREELDRAMGIVPRPRVPYERLETGELRINAIRPSDWRAHLDESVEEIRHNLMGGHRFGGPASIGGGR